MASSPFICTEHIIDCQHIREYPRATRTGDDALKLAVKKYTPRSNPYPQPGDLTIIGAHGCGFPKEVYEPLWEEILSRANRDGLRIRSIWIADSASQAASGRINKEYLGNEPSWFDHSRDLLYMINQFKVDMPRPIIGIGHSLGAGQLVLLSLIHPRLFTSLVLIEPVMEKDTYTGKGPEFVNFALHKTETWPSRAQAATHFKKIYKKWDSRALELWMEYGLRNLRPGIDSNEASGSVVTLSTSKHQEVAHYLRPNFLNKKPLDMDKELDPEYRHDPCFYPDVVGPPHAVYPFYRYEPILAWKLLKHVRPSVLYLFGERSPVSTPELRAEKLERTGGGIGGSGGYKNNRVKEITIPNTGHNLPFEDFSRVSDATAQWLSQETMKWREEEERIMKGWLELPPSARSSISDDWDIHLKSSLEGPKPEPRSKL